MAKVSLTGDSVEYYCAKISKLRKKVDGKPFVLVKNLLCVWPHVAGIPVLKSVNDLTRVVFKSFHKDVISLREMLEPGV